MTGDLSVRRGMRPQGSPIIRTLLLLLLSCYAVVLMLLALMLLQPLLVMRLFLDFQRNIQGALRNDRGCSPAICGCCALMFFSSLLHTNAKARGFLPRLLQRSGQEERTGLMKGDRLCPACAEGVGGPGGDLCD